MRRKHPSIRALAATTAGVALAILSLGTAPATPQTVRTERPWEGWYQPLSDGLVGLRFGMDRFTCSGLLRARGFEGRPSRQGTQRLEGRLLDEPVTAVLAFADTARSGAGGQLYSIQLHWSLTGLARVPLRLFEQLDGLLASRYGAPLAVEDRGVAALETGSGLQRKLYEGPEARALLELRSPRPERFDLILRLENPQLQPAPEADS